MPRSPLLSLLRSITAAIAFASSVLVSPQSSAQTADEQFPEEEQICDGKTGALWGLCVTYCEAMDCDTLSPLASEEACDHVWENYLEESNGALPPCEEISAPE